MTGLILGSAYKDQFGDNFTSAIPTNVFGPHDNLYVPPIHSQDTRTYDLQRPRRLARHPGTHP